VTLTWFRVAIPLTDGSKRVIQGWVPDGEDAPRRAAIAAMITTKALLGQR
jgi:hypothetical protein